MRCTTEKFQLLRMIYFSSLSRHKVIILNSNSVVIEKEESTMFANPQILLHPYIFYRLRSLQISKADDKRYKHLISFPFEIFAFATYIVHRFNSLNYTSSLSSVILTFPPISVQRYPPAASQTIPDRDGQLREREKETQRIARGETTRRGRPAIEVSGGKGEEKRETTSPLNVSMRFESAAFDYFRYSRAPYEEGGSDSVSYTR